MVQTRGIYAATALLLLVAQNFVLAITRLGLRNYQDITIEDAERHGDMMLNQYFKSLEKFRDDRFPNFVCSSPDGLLQSDSFASVCEVAWSNVFMPFCAHIKAFKDHLSHCGQALRNDMESVDSIYCLLAHTTFELIWKVLMEMFEHGCESWSRMSTADMQNWCYSSTADHHPYFFQQGRHFVERYYLKTSPNMTKACARYWDVPKANGVVEDHEVINGRTILHRTSSSLHFTHGRYGIPPVSEMCWQPTLQEPNVLYHKPGRWDVSMECVTLLQTLTAAMHYEMMKWDTTYDNLQMKDFLHVLQSFPEDSNFRRWSVKVFRVYLEVYQLAYDKIELTNQLWVYPMFRRFEETALQRKGADNMTSPAVVSCAGLQGTREDVVSSVIQLVRLCIVNDLVVCPYDRPFDRQLFKLEYWLPCLAEDAI